MSRARFLLAVGLLLLAALLSEQKSPAAADSSFALGLAGAAPATYASLRQAGLRAIKIVADWSVLEPARGRFAWAALDEAVAAARREGLQPVIVLSFTPGWATLATGADARNPQVATRTPPRSVAEWERFVGEAVRRYRDTVKEWQVWTVPNLPEFRGTASEYLSLVTAARRAVQAVDPAGRVVVASPRGFDLVHVQRALTQAAPAVGVISLTPTGLAPEQWLRPLAALRARVLPRGERSLWLEWMPDPNDAAPAALVRAVAVARTAEIERLFLTGLPRLDEPARSVLAALEGLPFTGYLVRGPGVIALVYGAAERATLVAWRSEQRSSEQRSTEGGAGTVDVPVLPAARIITLDGNPPAPPPGREKVALPLSAAPVLVTGVAPALVEEARATFQQRGPLLPVVPPERDFSGAVEVSIRLGRDPAARGLSVVPTARPGPLEPVEVGGEQAARIPAGADAVFLQFNVDDTYLYFNDNRFAVQVSVDVRGAPAAQSIGFNLFYDARTGYRFTPWQWIEARDGWVTQTFRLEDANFADTLGWDFALNPGANRRVDLVIRNVTVRKVAR